MLHLLPMLPLLLVMAVMLSQQVQLLSLITRPEDTYCWCRTDGVCCPINVLLGLLMVRLKWKTSPKILDIVLHSLMSVVLLLLLLRWPLLRNVTMMLKGLQGQQQDGLDSPAET